ncbi:MAG: hypothetical protein A3G76_07650 [Acidobacteria bacterium RIFCSPLOWO2_12_FULL_65_11]|nr:MAG: hypothetical protein A3G76_07650 [Acidobacteria bacterium RIFCSPLOWO2_12_FULL_65_11]
MRKTLLALAVLATAAVSTVRAQDVKATLAAASEAMGSVQTVQYSGTGTNAAFGQAYAPGGPWATFKVTDYNVALDYVANTMRIRIERTNPDGPARGGGGLPLFGAGNPQRLNQALNNRVAWNVNPNPAPGADPNVPQQAALAGRLLEFWSTPHAVLVAAEANNATAAGRVIGFTIFGAPVSVTLGADNLVSKVEYRTDQPVVGDTLTEITYSQYKQFGRAKFPTRIVTRQGGFPILDITVASVEVNGILNTVPVPASVQQAYAANPPPARNAAPPPTMVTTTKVADGVFYLTGGSHHSMAVEFADFSLLFEVPQNDTRAMAVIQATRQAIPNKPLRYVVNSHNHFDHMGGVRAAMAEGISIITHTANKPYYEQIAKMPHTISPDLLAKSPKTPVIEAVAAKRVIGDATQTLEIHPLPTNHTSTMLVGYLPKQKILFEVDMFNAPAANAPPAPVSPNTVAFLQQLQRMNLDVQQILAGHGPGATTLADLRRVVGAAQ